MGTIGSSVDKQGILDLINKNKALPSRVVTPTVILDVNKQGVTLPADNTNLTATGPISTLKMGGMLYIIGGILILAFGYWMAKRQGII